MSLECFKYAPEPKPPMDYLDRLQKLFEPTGDLQQGHTERQNVIFWGQRTGVHSMTLYGQRILEFVELQWLT